MQPKYRCSPTFICELQMWAALGHGFSHPPLPCAPENSLPICAFVDSWSTVCPERVISKQQKNTLKFRKNIYSSNGVLPYISLILSHARLLKCNCLTVLITYISLIRGCHKPVFSQALLMNLLSSCQISHTRLVLMKAQWTKNPLIKKNIKVGLFCTTRLSEWEIPVMRRQVEVKKASEL